MGNQVSIKVDSRVFYGLVALLAVVGIFAIGLWLGGQLGGTPEQTTAAPQSNEVAPLPVDPGGGAAVPGVPPAAPPVEVAETGANPVSADAVPVEEGQPRIWIPEAADTNWQYDFGSIPANDKIEHEFEVTNIGLGVLEIQDASASCGCTAALVADSTLEPGETTTIRVTYDPRVNQEFGKFITKQIRVKSNDPLVPLAEFTITADVQSQ